MKIYAIRHKTNGLFLSDGKALAKTRAALSNKPRLFKRRCDAKNALNCWVMGVWSNRIDSYGETDGPEPPMKKPDDRNKEDFEIVEAECDFK